jgi:hypothetical protein
MFHQLSEFHREVHQKKRISGLEFYIKYQNKSDACTVVNTLLNTVRLKPDWLFSCFVNTNEYHTLENDLQGVAASNVLLSEVIFAASVKTYTCMLYLTLVSPLINSSSYLHAYS